MGRTRRRMWEEEKVCSGRGREGEGVWLREKERNTARIAKVGQVEVTLG